MSDVPVRGPTPAKDTNPIIDGGEVGNGRGFP
jgi:hypothetical protein